MLAIWPCEQLYAWADAPALLILFVQMQLMNSSEEVDIN